MAVVKLKNDPVRLFWRRIGMSVLAIFILFASWAVVDVVQKKQDSQTLRKESEAQLKEFEAREVALKARIASLETLRGQEAALRNAYSIGREGEGMVQIVDRPASTSEKQTPESKSWLSRIFGW